MNAGPDRLPRTDLDDAPQGTTSKLEPELRGKPERGSRSQGDG